MGRSPVDGAHIPNTKSDVDICPDIIHHLTLAIEAEEAQQAFDYPKFYRALRREAHAGPYVAHDAHLGAVSISLIV